jgi:iron complex outermembrane receptor protein
MVVFGLSAMKAQGQVDTLLQIPMVEISAEGIRSESPGSQISRWSVEEIMEIPVSDLSELLQKEGIYIKSYGLGSLATSSIRGGAASHTLVLWNGLPVQSPMLGQLDLSLLPLESFISVSLERGGGSGAWGSGAIGGVINLQNGPSFSEGVGISSETVLGDFGRIRQATSVKAGSQKFFSKTSFEYREARNDFTYPISDDLPERRQTNAELSQRLFTQNFGWKISDKDQISAHLWYQNSFREIPPTNVQTRSLAEQKDEATRATLRYKHESSRFQLNAKAALFDEAILFVDPLIGLKAPSSFKTYLAEATAQYALNERHKIFLGTTQAITQADAEEYAETAEEYRWSLFGMWRYEAKSLTLQASLRQEAFDGEFVTPVPAFGAEYRPLKNWVVKGKVSKNFRLPTLNDRFWVPGGNPDLMAETGWSQEATLENNFWLEKSFIKWSVTGFNREMDNWIMWSPDASSGFWSASNLATVWSRGMEFRASGAFSISEVEFSVDGGYDRILSTNEGISDVPGMEVGEQLLYTPGQLAFASISVTWSGLSVSYRHNYTGEARGVNELIPEFQTADVRLQYSGKEKQGESNIGASFFFDIMNLYDTDYFVIDRRPMPGINFQAGIRITCNHSKSSL